MGRMWISPGMRSRRGGFSLLHCFPFLLFLLSITVFIQIVSLWKKPTSKLEFTDDIIRREMLFQLSRDQDETIGRHIIFTSAQQKKIHQRVLDSDQCELLVMMRTTSGSEYISEVLAYYIVQGASIIFLEDYSRDNSTRDTIKDFISSGYVSYIRAKENFVFEEQAFKVHDSAMRIIGAYEQVGHHVWLLSVDDDEFVLPTKDKINMGKEIERRLPSYDKATIREFLCRKDVLDYKSVRFRWRYVGTNKLHSVADKNGKLDIEAYVNMMPYPNSRQAKGKTAFHIVGANVSKKEWDYHGESIPGNKNPRRTGGPYFMHGNLAYSHRKVDDVIVSESPWLGDFAILQHGYTFHFSRSVEQLEDRINRWNKTVIVNNKRRDAKKLKNNNLKNSFVLYVWSKKVRFVMQQLESGQYYFSRNDIRNTPFSNTFPET